MLLFVPRGAPAAAAAAAAGEAPADLAAEDEAAAAEEEAEGGGGAVDLIGAEEDAGEVDGVGAVGGTAAGAAGGSPPLSWPSATTAAGSPLPPPLPEEAAPASCFPCAVVGRGFQAGAGAPLPPGARLAVRPEHGNPRDAQALLVFAAGGGAGGGAEEGRPVGHLPRGVAALLGPLLRAGAAAAAAVVAGAPAGARAPLPVELHVAILLEGGAAAAAARAAAAAAVAAARYAAAAAGGGDRLRAAFAALAGAALRHDAHLFDAAELSAIRAIQALPPEPQRLLLRLSQRAGPAFRAAALAYEDVPDAGAAVEALVRARLLARCAPGADDGSIWWEALAGVLTAPELRAAAAALAPPGAPAPRGARAGAAAAVGRAAAARAAPARAAARAALLAAAAGAVVALAPPAAAAVARLQRVVLLVEGQSLATLAAAGAGALRYPRYAPSRTRTVFACRADLLAYEAALAQAAVLSAALEAEDWDAAEAAVAPAFAALDAGAHKEAAAGVSGGAGGSTSTSTAPSTAALAPMFLRRYCAAWVHVAMATAGVSVLERRRRYREAADRLQQLLGGWPSPGRRGGWWARLSTDLEHLGHAADALEVAEAALADGALGRGDRLGLQRRALRLGRPPRRWRRPPWAAAALREPREARLAAPLLPPPGGGPPLPGAKSRFASLADDSKVVGVEELALEHYAQPANGGWRGAHCEGGAWSSLFGLLFYEALFDASVPDALRAPLQAGPLDLDEPDGAFYAARAPFLEARLAAIAAGGAPALLAAAWAAHEGEVVRGVAWERWSPEKLAEIAACVGGPALAAVCRLLAEDHGGWRGGMPDLLLWRPDADLPPGAPRARLVEVKGPRDRLSDQQRAWLAALEDAAGLECEVLKVSEPAAGGGGRRRARTAESD
jgi:Fanconi-associated nuclease 1